MKMLLGIENGKKVPYPLGHFFIAININAFIEPAEFKKTTGDILRELRDSRKMPGQQRIYTAGEKEYLTWLEREHKGVPLNEALQKEIKQLVQECNITGYEFPF
jgi:LDH2 family malate/lactate/ureidoglycolate dehydrogenase